MTRIVLHIDRLVLRGVARTDATTVAQALQAELGALLATHGPGTLAAQVAVARLPASRVPMPQGASAADLGRAVAASVVSTGTT